MIRSVSESFIGKVDGFIALLVLASIVGCSFQSNQINFLRSLIAEDNLSAVAEWEFQDSLQRKKLIPISDGNMTLFTDGGDLLFKFDGWHIIEIRGYRALEEPASVDFVTFGYHLVAELPKKYDLGNGRPSEAPDLNRAERRYAVICSSWQRVPEVNGTHLVQQCLLEGNMAFSNGIDLDRSGNIVRIQSVLGSSGRNFEIFLNTRS